MSRIVTGAEPGTAPPALSCDFRAKTSGRWLLGSIPTWTRPRQAVLKDDAITETGKGERTTMDLWGALDVCDNELPYGCLTSELARVTATLDVVPNDGSVWGAASISQFVASTGHLVELQGITKADSVDDRSELLVERVDEALIQELVRAGERVSEMLDTGWTPHPFALPEMESTSLPSTYYETPTSAIDVLASLQKRMASSSPALFRAARLSLERAVSLRRSAPPASDQSEARKRTRIEHVRKMLPLGPSKTCTPQQVTDFATTTSMETIGKLPPADAVSPALVARDSSGGSTAEKRKQKQLYRDNGVLLLSAVEALETSRQHDSATSVATVSRFCTAMRMLGRLPEATPEGQPEFEPILRRGLTCCLDLLRKASMDTWNQRAVIAEWVFSLSQTPTDLFGHALQEEHLELSVQTLRQGLDRATNLLDQSARAINHAGFESILQPDSTPEGERETGWHLWKRCALLLAKLADLMGSHIGIGESQHLQSVFVALAAVSVTDSIADRVHAAGTERGCSAIRRETKQFSASVWSSTARILGAAYVRCVHYRTLIVDEARVLLKDTRRLDALGWHDDSAVGSATWFSNCTGRYPPVGLLSTLLDVIGRTIIASFTEKSMDGACAPNDSARDLLEPTSRLVSTPVFMQSATNELLHASSPFIETAFELLFAYLSHHRDALRSVSRNRLALLLRYLEYSLRHSVSSEPVSLILLQLLIRHTLAWSASLGHQHADENLLAAERCLRIAELIQSLLKMEGVYDPPTSIHESPERLCGILVGRNPLWLLLAGTFETHRAADDTLTEAQLPARLQRGTTSPVRTGHRAAQLPSPAAIIRGFRSFLERSLEHLHERALALLHAALGSPRATLRARAVRLFGEISRMGIKDGWQVSKRGVDRAEQLSLQKRHSPMAGSHGAGTQIAATACTAPEAPATRESLGQAVDPAESSGESLIDRAIALATACCLDMSPRVREAALVPYVSWMHLSGKPITDYTVVYSRLCDVSVAVRQRAIQTLDSLLWEKEPLSMTDWAFATAHLFLRLDDPLPAIRQLAQRVLYAHVFRRQIVFRESQPNSMNLRNEDFDFLIEDAPSQQTEAVVGPGQPLRRSRRRVRYLDEQREWQVSPLKRLEGSSSFSTGPFQRMLLVCERLDREFATDGALATSTLARRFLLIDEGVVALTRAEATNMANFLMKRQAYSPLVPLIQLDAQLAVPFLPVLVNRLHSLAMEPNLSSGAERELFWIIRILESCSRVVGQAKTDPQLWSMLEWSVARLVFRLPLANEFLASEAVRLLRALHDHNEHVSSWLLRNAAYWQRIDSIWGLLERLWADTDSHSSLLREHASENHTLCLTLDRLGKLIRYAPEPTQETVVRLHELHEKLLTQCSAIRSVPSATTLANAMQFRMTVLSVLECLLELTFYDENFALKQLPLWQWLMDSTQRPDEVAGKVLSPSLAVRMQERLLRHLVDLIQCDRSSAKTFHTPVLSCKKTVSTAWSDGMTCASGPGRFRVPAVASMDVVSAARASAAYSHIAALDVSEKQSNVVFGLVQAMIPSVLAAFETAKSTITETWLANAARLCYLALIDGIVHPDALIKALCCILWASSTNFETKATTPRMPLEQARHPSVIARQALQHLVMHEGPSVASGFRDTLLSAWRFCRNRYVPSTALSTGRDGDAAIAAETRFSNPDVESPHPDEINRFLRLNLRCDANEHICGFVFAGLRAPALRRRVLQELVGVLTSSPLDERYPIDERCSIALFLATLPRSDESSSPETAQRAEIRSVLEALDRNLDAMEDLLEVAPSESSIDGLDVIVEPPEADAHTFRCRALQLQLALLLQERLIESTARASSAASPVEALRDMVAIAITPSWPTVFRKAREQWIRWQERASNQYGMEDLTPESDQLGSESVPDSTDGSELNETVADTESSMHSDLPFV